MSFSASFLPAGNLGNTEPQPPQGGTGQYPTIGAHKRPAARVIHFPWPAAQALNTTALTFAGAFSGAQASRAKEERLIHICSNL
jgi:hypothetical protein